MEVMMCVRHLIRTWRQAVWIFGLVFLFAGSCANAPAVITLKPGDDIQRAVDAAAAGTMFILEPGIYRGQSVKPKDDQQFVGRGKVVFNGAIVLSNWSEENGLWVSRGLPNPLGKFGRCDRDHLLCAFREDLFIDHRLNQRVDDRGALKTGQWFYGGNAVYLAEKPDGRRVELGVTVFAFGGNAKHVSLRNIVIEKYASAAQRGAIDGRQGEGWRVIDITARWNHGVGLYLGNRMRVVRGAYVHNGQLGIGGEGDDIVIEGTEIAHNNYAGFSAGWEAGGTKFVRSKGLIVRGACVHHNKGPGLWTDIDNVDIVFEDNKVFENDGDGIKHEISYAAKIRNNVVARNGRGKDNWLWGSQILVQSSSNVEVYRNYVEISEAFGNGIAVIHQSRKPGPFGKRNSKNNLIHHNLIVHSGARGRNGLVADFDREEFWENYNNRFNQNTYIVPSRFDAFFGINNRFGSWTDLQAQGFERGGIIKLEQRSPRKISCKNTR